MFWKRASVKMMQQPWKEQNISAFKYFMKEFPEVVFAGGIFAIFAPILATKKYYELSGSTYENSAFKQNFIVLRTNEMPTEGKPYCITEAKLKA